MKFIASILAAGILGFILFACASGVVTTTTPSPAAACTSGGAAFVAAKVFKLSPTFDATQGSAPAAKDVMGSVTIADPYYLALTSGFDAAPPFFKSSLCGLNAVYVVQNTCTGTCTAKDLVSHSWGLRAYQTGGAPEYVAISQQLLLNPALTLSAFETQRLNYLLFLLSPAGATAWFNTNNYPIYTASPDTFPLTVLAALAHEHGHVLWFDNFVHSPGGPRDTDIVFCNGQNGNGRNKFNSFYPPGYWNKISLPSFNNKRWINFGDKNDQYLIDYITPLTTALSSNSFYPAADKALHAVLQDDSLTDLLSALSSNEDFVTAYELYVLQNARVTALSVQLRDNSGATVYSDDILGKLGIGKDLAEKIKCFQ
ncbi:MAG: hypothetical protein JOY83_06505 [Alphaproteobacteria bacterium]|nr:hypothetical protein [Alphaproteobacteria bacterium]